MERKTCSPAFPVVAHQNEITQVHCVFVALYRSAEQTRSTSCGSAKSYLIGTSGRRQLSRGDSASVCEATQACLEVGKLYIRAGFGNGSHC